MTNLYRSAREAAEALREVLNTHMQQRAQLLAALDEAISEVGQEHVALALIDKVKAVPAEDAGARPDTGPDPARRAERGGTDLQGLEHGH